MVSKAGTALRAFTTFLRALQFLIAVLVLGIFSYFLACVSTSPFRWQQYHVLIPHRSLDTPFLRPHMDENC